MKEDQQAKMTQGKAISAQLASEEIGAYLEMMKPTRPKLVEFCEKKLTEGVLTALPGSRANPATYFSTEANAFIFDANLVSRFFSSTAPDGTKQKPADVLLVFLGMVKDDGENIDRIGTPTVVLAGCYQDSENNTFKSMNLPGMEATEFPPKTLIQIFPNKDQIKEKIKREGEALEEETIETSTLYFKVQEK